MGPPKTVTLCLPQLREHARRTRDAYFNKRTARLPTVICRNSHLLWPEARWKHSMEPLCSLFFFSKSDCFISAVHLRAGTCEALIQALAIYCIFSSGGVTFSVINLRGDWLLGLVPQSNLLSPNFTFEQCCDVGGPAHPFFLQHQVTAHCWSWNTGAYFSWRFTIIAYLCSIRNNSG